MISDPMVVMAVCAAACALVLLSADHPRGQRIFRVVPSVLLIYYLPTALSSAGILPSESPAYEWMRDYMLPFSLFLLMVSTDLRAVLRIGPKAMAMMLIGALGILVGGPVALFCFRHWLPQDAWKAMAALSGSWIGGSGNFAAIKEAVGAPDDLIGPIIVVDTAVAYTWTGILLFMVRFQGSWDRLIGASSDSFRQIGQRLEDLRKSEAHPLTLTEAAAILGLGLSVTVSSHAFGAWLFALTDPLFERFLPVLGDVFSAFTWMIVAVSTLGILLSLTRLRRLENAGASRFGYLALYLFLTSLGAKASPAGLLEAPVLLLVGIVWIAVHVFVLILASMMLRVPIFLAATASQANIGGVATAPIVAEAYCKGLAPVGVLMGVLGYLLGNYLGLLCALLLRLVSG